MTEKEETKKYSAENNRGYRGILGYFTYMMRTANRLDEEDIVKERQISESKLIYAYNNKEYPEVKEMIECAFHEEMRGAKKYLEETKKTGNHIDRRKCEMFIDELNRLKAVIGIETKEKTNEVGSTNITFNAEELHDEKQIEEETNIENATKDLDTASNETQKRSSCCSRCCILL